MTTSANGFSDSRYVLDDAIASVQALQHFRETNAPHDLDIAGAVLCGALSRLQADDGFWNGLSDAIDRTREQHDAIQERLRDLDVFLVIEETALAQILGDMEMASRLLSEFAQALELAFLDGDDGGVQDVRERLGALRDAVCSARATPPPIPQPGSVRRARFFNTLRTIARGNALLIGAAFVVANGLSSISGALDPVAALASAVEGFGLIERQVRRERG
jgi:hypothetical protein